MPPAASLPAGRTGGVTKDVTPVPDGRRRPSNHRMTIPSVPADATLIAERQAAPPERDIPVLRIRPSRGWVSLQLRELLEYRELLFFMVWRDVKVRYKQTALGASWAVIQPFMTMVVFSIFFGKLAKMPSDGVPYPIFSFTALVPWTFFVTGLTNASNSLVGNSNILRKVYFPRLVIPVSTVLSGVIDFAISFAVLVGMMAWYGIVPGIRVVVLPLLLLLALMTALGAGLWLSAINVQYRDVKYIVPFLAQFWMFATPVAYPSSLLQEPWHTLYGLNPMVGVVEGFRWALVGAQTAPWNVLWASTASAVLLLVTGAFYFRRMERSFADLV